MTEPTTQSLSRHFSQLIGRDVSFSKVPASSTTGTLQIYGLYNVFPQNATVVVIADLTLLGSFAGALVGLPDSEVRQHVSATPMDELLRDAIFEVLNVASAAITREGRAVFDRMTSDRTALQGNPERVLTKPARAIYFNVSVDGYQGGRFAVLA